MTNKTLWEVNCGNSLSTNLYNVNRHSVNYQITIIATTQVFHTSVYHPKSCILRDPPGMQFTIIFHVIYNIISCKLLDLSTLSKLLSLSPCNLPCNSCMSIYMVKYIIIFGKKTYIGVQISQLSDGTCDMSDKTDWNL